MDWADIPRRRWKSIRDGDFSPQYDAVFIDEAQFFAPVWLEIVQKLVHSKTGHLFLPADPTQGFLRLGISWKSLGFDVREHTHRLTKSYRTIRAILNFATLFYRQRVTRQEETLFASNLLDMPRGPIPELISLHSNQGEIFMVANEVECFARVNFPSQDILILHANCEGVSQLIQAIQNRLRRNAAIDPKDSYPGAYVRVTTLNTGTGIESPIVFLGRIAGIIRRRAKLAHLGYRAGPDSARNYAKGLYGDDPPRAMSRFHLCRKNPGYSERHDGSLVVRVVPPICGA